MKLRPDETQEEEEQSGELLLDIPWGKVGLFIYKGVSIATGFTLLMLFFVLHYPGEWALLGHNKLKVWRKGKPEELEDEDQPSDEGVEPDITVNIDGDQGVPPPEIEGEGVGDQVSTAEEGGVQSTQGPHIEDNSSENQSDAFQEPQLDNDSTGADVRDGPKAEVFQLIEGSSSEEETAKEQVDVSEK